MVIKAKVAFFEDEDGHTVYITDVEKDGITWQRRIRYNKFETLHKLIKPDLVGVTLPGLRK
jgi:hypothetical protein